MSEIIENTKGEEEEEAVIELEDDEGTKISFELLDYIEHDGSSYIVLLPQDDEDGQVVILEVEEYEDGTEGYVSVDDDAVTEIYDIFKQRNADKYDFDD